MRKVTRKIVQSWARGDSLTVGNTCTNGEAIFLHGHGIVWKGLEPDVIVLTLAGWPTVTTRERLNGVLNFYGIGYRFAQRNFEPVLIHRVGAFGRDVIEIDEHEHVFFNIATQRLCDPVTG